MKSKKIVKFVTEFFHSLAIHSRIPQSIYHSRVRTIMTSTFKKWVEETSQLMLQVLKICGRGREERSEIWEIMYTYAIIARTLKTTPVCVCVQTSISHVESHKLKQFGSVVLHSIQKQPVDTRVIQFECRYTHSSH